MVVREEVVSSGPSGVELVWRTGPRKPKLSSLTIPQWSVANLVILSRLQDEGRLDATSPLDYLSYTRRIYQLLQRYDQVSVYGTSMIVNTGGYKLKWAFAGALR